MSLIKQHLFYQHLFYLCPHCEDKSFIRREAIPQVFDNERTWEEGNNCQCSCYSLDVSVIGTDVVIRSGYLFEEGNKGVEFTELGCLVQVGSIPVPGEIIMCNNCMEFLALTPDNIQATYGCSLCGCVFDNEDDATECVKECWTPKKEPPLSDANLLEFVRQHGSPEAVSKLRELKDLASHERLTRNRTHN